MEGGEGDEGFGGGRGCRKFMICFFFFLKRGRESRVEVDGVLGEGRFLVRDALSPSLPSNPFQSDGEAPFRSPPGSSAPISRRTTSARNKDAHVLVRRARTETRGRRRRFCFSILMFFFSVSKNEREGATSASISLAPHIEAPWFYGAQRSSKFVPSIGEGCPTRVTSRKRTRRRKAGRPKRGGAYSR